jgi:hypothetical protein
LHGQRPLEKASIEDFNPPISLVRVGGKKHRNLRASNMKLIVYLAAGFLVVGLNSATAGIVTYQFTGTTANVSNPPFGMPIPNGTAVSGKFQYDTSVPPFSTVGNLSIYPQSIANGLQANFGTYLVSASSYMVKIRNDQAGSDIFTIQWSSSDNPAPSSPLIANGSSQTAGIFGVMLAYLSNPFSDTSLPSTLPITGYLPSPSYLSQQSNPLDVPFLLSSLVAVPEPACWSMGVVGLMTIGIECWRRARHNRCASASRRRSG